MKKVLRKKKRYLPAATIWVVLILFGLSASATAGLDLKEIREKGVIRHLGIVYANFVTGSGDGLDVEFMKLFADHLGVKYEFVETSWTQAIPDLTGKQVTPKGDDVDITGKTSVKGDVVATGFTILPWRKKVIDYSTPSFPTQIWLVTRASSDIIPITPCGDMDLDIQAVKGKLKGYSVLGIKDTCLDPNLYEVKESGASGAQFTQTINAMVPAVINAEADTTLLEVPDALTALQKFPGKIKVIGPLSPMQNMAYAFDKDASALRDEFNKFYEKCRKNGTYANLVKKYYPLVFDYYPQFFE
jgi:ABC-type amino acid transport substrate-binding protein